MSDSNKYLYHNKDALINDIDSNIVTNYLAKRSIVEPYYQLKYQAANNYPYDKLNEKIWIDPSSAYAPKTLCDMASLMIGRRDLNGSNLPLWESLNINEICHSQDTMLPFYKQVIKFTGYETSDNNLYTTTPSSEPPKVENSNNLDTKMVGTIIDCQANDDNNYETFSYPWIGKNIYSNDKLSCDNRFSYKVPTEIIPTLSEFNKDFDFNYNNRVNYCSSITSQNECNQSFQGNVINWPKNHNPVVICRFDSGTEKCTPYEYGLTIDDNKYICNTENNSCDMDSNGNEDFDTCNTNCVVNTTTIL